MKFRNILRLFFYLLFLCVILRTVSLFVFVDYKTGFFKPEDYGKGISITMAILMVAVGFAAVAGTVRRSPLKTPTVNSNMGGFSAILGVAIALDTVVNFYALSASLWQAVILAITGASAALFFFAYSYKAIRRYNLPRILYTVPVFYWLCKLVLTFISISSLALISENAIMVLYLCLTLVFMLEFAKIANSIDKKHNYKKILISGTLAVIFAESFAIPQLLLVMLVGPEAGRNGVLSYITAALTGIFITIYLMNHFRNRNLAVHRHHKKARGTQDFKTSDGDSDIDFYIK